MMFAACLSALDLAAKSEVKDSCTDSKRGTFGTLVYHIVASI